MSAREYFAYKKNLVPDVLRAYHKLEEDYDIIVIEGAGSPAEINLKQEDIVNMGMAKMAKAPVLLVGDIDRGGVFAQLVGTVMLLEEDEKAMRKGLIINKFRGDKTILEPGVAMLEERAGIPVVGVAPYLQIEVEDEDSLTERFSGNQEVGLIDIAVIRLPRISNFTDFNPFESMEGVSLRYVHSVSELKNPDMIILPGTKNTMEDLLWMRQNGLEAAVLKQAAAGKIIFGVCGGYQMLGETLSDPSGVEAGGEIKGMGLLPMDTVFEKEKEPGGMLRYGIPSFRLEKDVINAEIEIIRTMGAEIRCGIEVGKDITLDELRSEGYKAFYVAIGMQGGRLAGVPGEDAEGVETGVDFLRRVNLDTSQKLTGKTVVVGGGNVAVDVARTALRAGAGETIMVCLESRNEMPASVDEVEEVKQEGIQIENGWGPKEILTENGKVTGIVFKKCISVFDAEHRFCPQYDEEEVMTIPCSNVLMSIGQKAEWGNILDGSKVITRSNGTAEADPVTFQTAEDDIFVGGDISHGARFAIDAIADGKEGMVSIHRFVHPGQSLTIGRDRREFIELDRDDVLIESYDTSKRQKPAMQEGEAVKTYKDMRLLLTEEQIRAEAKRCLHCGATTVDENRCIGCGLCTTKCEFDAIHISRDLPENSQMYSSEEGMMKAVMPYAMKRKEIIMSKIQQN